MTETITADRGMDMDTYINYGEAMEESERLKRVTGKHFVVVRDDCDCDYERTCGRCAGEGCYYVIVEQTVVRAESAPLLSCREMEIQQKLAQEELEVA